MKAEPISSCGDCEQRIEQLFVRISELEDQNSKLRALDNAVRRNNALFSALLAHNSGGIALTGPDRRIVRVVRGLTGMNPMELSGILIESLAVREDREMIVEAYRQLLRQTAATVKLRLRVNRVDGTIARFSATLSDMLDDPNVQCIVWNYVDVTGSEG